MKEEYLNNMVNEEFWRLADKFGMKIPDKLIKAGEDVKMDSKKIKDLNSADQNANFKTMYRYEGITAERNFCKRMLSKDKFYTKSEIDVISFKGINKKFGHKGQNYSIFKYKGGVNCKHRWVEYAVSFNGKRITQAVNMGDAPGDAGEKANSSNNYWRYPS